MTSRSSNWLLSQKYCRRPRRRKKSPSLIQSAFPNRQPAEAADSKRRDLMIPSSPPPTASPGAPPTCSDTTTSDAGSGSDTQSDQQVGPGNIISESVVSLVSYLGTLILSECTGILNEDLYDDFTTILTSASSFVRSIGDVVEDVVIKLRLPDKEIARGTLHYHEPEHDIAVVVVTRALRFQRAHLKSTPCIYCMEVEPDLEVVAVGRRFESGSGWRDDCVPTEES
ncbi:uncharacterized protein LOC111255906 [Setaria italica]|uniref:uncharacterized protein LOC111255906 n=1 Tax=Setaria italica TaxID=4555 RepID=UPI000BE574B7|nr:uncharacterized protein LOC111255906 [Setaria italica]